jgi:hypothetical protein
VDFDEEEDVDFWKRVSKVDFVAVEIAWAEAREVEVNITPVVVVVRIRTQEELEPQAV